MGDAVDLPEGFEIVSSGVSDLPDGFELQSQPQQFPAEQGNPILGIGEAPSPDSYAVQGMSGVASGASNIAGMPVDAYSGWRGLSDTVGNWANEKLGIEGFYENPLPEIPQEGLPFSSQQLKGGMKDLGLIQPESQDAGKRILRRGLELGTEVAVPMSLLNKAKYVDDAVRHISSPTLKNKLASIMSNAYKSIGGKETALGAASGIAGQTVGEVTGSETAQTITELGVGLSPLLGMGAKKLLGDTGSIQETIKDFADIGATPTVAQATGKGAGAEKVVKTIPFGGKRFEVNAQRTRDAIQNTIQKNLDDIGGVHTRQGTGQVLQKGFKSGGVTDRTSPDFDLSKLGYIEREIVRSGDLYDEAAKLLPDDFKVTMPNTSAAARDILSDLGDAPSYSQGMQSDKVSSKARQILSDLQDSSFMPYDTIKKIRSDIGEIMSELNTSQKSKYKKLYAGLSKDMDGATNLLSGEAKSAAKKANNHYKRYMQNVDENLKPLLNKKDPSHISNFLDRSGKQGSTQLRAVKNSLKPEEWNAYVSYQLDELGKAKAGKQDDIGSVFSSETFLTNWNNMPVETKDVLFHGKPDMRRDFDTIARVAANVRKSELALTNPSGTAKLATAVGVTTAGGAAVGTVNPLAVGGVVAGLLGNKALSVAMTSPKTLNWLAKGVKMKPEALAGHITRLAAIAQRGNEDDRNAALEIINILNPQE